jgi:phage shock protein B
MAEDAMGILVGGLAIIVLFVVLPWLILHYVTKWKVNSGLTAEDETMLDDLYELARRLDDRMHTIERIIQDDNPNWNALTADRGAPPLQSPEVSDLAPRGKTPNLTKRRRV